MIDVIINCFNAMKYMKDTLSGVFSQTAFSQINSIHIIDDGSTDNLKEYIKSLKEPKINYLWQENRGAAAARNVGIKLSKSKYIAFLDSDDIWCNNKIERQIEVLHNNDNIDILYTNVFGFYDLWPNNSIEKFRSIPYFGKGNLKKYFIYDSPLYPSTAIVKRQLFDTAGVFNEDLPRGHDTELFYRLFDKGYVYHMDEYLTYRRLLSDSLAGDVEKKLPQMEIAAKILIEKHPELAEFKAKRDAILYFICAKEKLSKFNDIKKARHFLGYSLKKYPLHFEVILLYLLTFTPLVRDKNFYNSIKTIYKRISGKF